MGFNGLALSKVQMSLPTISSGKLSSSLLNKKVGLINMTSGQCSRDFTLSNTNNFNSKTLDLDNSSAEAVSSASPGLAPEYEEHPSKIFSLYNRKEGAFGFGLSKKERQEIESGDYEEFKTSDLTEEEIQARMKYSLFGPKTREEVLEAHEKYVKKAREYNSKLNSTKASNGMSYPEAQRTYMRLYEKYIAETRVICPGSDGNLSYLDVVPSKLEEKMTPEDLDLFKRAKAAMAELEADEELMEVYKLSHTGMLYSKFSFIHSSDGLTSRQWLGTSYITEVPYI